MTSPPQPTQLTIDPDSCIGCRECVHGCPRGALSFTGTLLRRDIQACSRCLNCIEICPSLSHRVLENTPEPAIKKSP